VVITADRSSIETRSNNRKDYEIMISPALRYARYAVTSLATVAFGLATN
jgi:hypothetical protein